MPIGRVPHAVASALGTVVGMSAGVADLRSRRDGLLAIAVAIGVPGCEGLDVAHYQTVLDELAIPADWELAHASSEAPSGLDDCAPIFQSAHRFP